MNSRTGTASLGILLGHAVRVQVISYGMRPAISYAILDQGYDPVWLGTATAAFAVPPLLLALPSGSFIDRFGERRMLVAGAVAFVLAALSALFAGATLFGLIAATAFLGLGVLFSVVGEQAWVMRGAQAGRLDSAFGLYTFATSSGQMLGPLLLLLLHSGTANFPAFEGVTLNVLCAAVACLLLSALIRSRTTQGPDDPAPFHTPPTAQKRSQGSPGSLRTLLRRRGVVPALVASSLALSSLDILIAYLPLLAQERGLAPAWLSAMLVARGAATMLSRICLGMLTRRLGRRRVLVIAGIASAGSLILLATPSPPLALVAGMVVYGLTIGIVQPLTMSWITLVTPVRDLGVAASLRLLANRAGQTLLPIAIAGVTVGGGATLAFGVTGATLVTTAWLSRWAPNTDDSPHAGDPGP
ncbi:MFS transporter [Subtercola sp. RTI3]|uniref:MFS transporter n=1 Tax=Subtercola sp. RTI3 TaxID=3048639 RepID=UPI002B22C20A|nr:MFS transporter [Subtercola sp. RTI3]MEA9984254.1 MFS transporter [Subtercola sp. RTI3]